MTPVSELRRQNLDLLAEEAGTLDAVATRASTSPIYLSQIRNRTPDAKTGRPREMGGQIARRLERAFKKPTGWMDSQHLFAGEKKAPYAVAQDVSHRKLETGPVVTDRVPVIGTLQMGDSNELELRAGPGGAVIGTVRSVRTNDGVFSIRVVGDHLYPTVRHGSCLLINPDGPRLAGELVLLEMLDGHYLVCELVTERPESITVAPVQGGQRRTFDMADVAKVQCIAGILAGSGFTPIE